MEPIKMSVSVDVNVDLSQGTKDFLVALFAGHFVASNETATQTEKELHAVAEAEKEAAASVEAEVKKQEAKPAEEPKPAQTAKSVSIEDVRAVLATKVNEHREAIKAKLNELGAPSVTKLDTSKYQEMIDFLSKL